MPWLSLARNPVYLLAWRLFWHIWATTWLSPTMTKSSLARVMAV
jgi:hypothetical protein